MGPPAPIPSLPACLRRSRKWREYRALRDIESVPYSVMKDIGFRSTEQMNAK
jgi:hypothetical protein